MSWPGAVSLSSLSSATSSISSSFSSWLCRSLVLLHLCWVKTSSSSSCSSSSSGGTTLGSLLWLSSLSQLVMHQGCHPGRRAQCGRLKWVLGGHLGWRCQGSIQKQVRHFPLGAGFRQRPSLRLCSNYAVRNGEFDPLLLRDFASSREGHKKIAALCIAGWRQSDRASGFRLIGVCRGRYL